MEMDQSEYSAFKETLSETKQLAKEHDISLEEALLVRQVGCLRWICQALANKAENS